MAEAARGYADEARVCGAENEPRVARDMRGVGMDIERVTGRKKEYIELLLMADEQEDMIDRYLERGDMFVLRDGGVVAECVVTREAEGVYELKNIAVLPERRRMGCGKRLIDALFGFYPDCETMLVGTGDVPSSLAFYHKCGFTESHRVENFFTDNYDHIMTEDGIQLRDMVYLKRCPSKQALSKGAYT